MSGNRGFIDEYMLEAGELLDQVENILLHNANSQEHSVIYNMIFRNFHSLKGSAGMMGFDNLQRHMHSLEDHLQRCKNDKLKLERSIDYYLLGVDAARKMLKGEVVQFKYEVDRLTSQQPDPQTVKKTIKRILYISNKTTFLFKDELESFKVDDSIIIKYLKLIDVLDGTFNDEDYDILLIDFSINKLKEILPTSKYKIPTILISKNKITDALGLKLHGIIYEDDSNLQFNIMINSALKAYLFANCYEKAKNIIMFMYCDLEDYLNSTNQLESQNYLNHEIKKFIKDYTG